MAQAVRSLSPKQILERTQLHRQAVIQFARLAAKRAVKEEMRAQGIRLTLVFPAEIMRQAREYLDTHPELYQQALERAKRMGYVDPCADITTNAQKHSEPKSTTSALQISGAK
jgi:hypothetical protein